MPTYQSYIIALHTDIIDDSDWNQYFDIETGILNKRTPMLTHPSMLTPMLSPTLINKKQLNLDEDLDENLDEDIETGNKGTDNKGTDNKGTDNKGTDNKGTDNKGTDNKGTDNKEMPIEQKTNHFINFQYLIISSIFYISHLVLIIFILVV
jgi:hypothetical protein